eukprot:TRINITY_DN46554_c0_g1_i1.p1 TRINITY_DN46554_c0_g1~~TRINITY_DN46554_c0_g1_i1.p1  ORF type:complete len:262 (-),score=34.50 TRINITY_DN46554_c0_g1_i1:57-842(-)
MLSSCVFFFKQKTAYEMLRSLVGSEMCIRDRCAGCGGSGCWTCQMSHRKQECVVGLLPGSEPAGCSNTERAGSEAESCQQRVHARPRRRGLRTGVIASDELEASQYHDAVIPQPDTVSQRHHAVSQHQNAVSQRGEVGQRPGEVSQRHEEGADQRLPEKPGGKIRELVSELGGVDAEHVLGVLEAHKMTLAHLARALGLLSTMGATSTRERIDELVRQLTKESDASPPKPSMRRDCACALAQLVLRKAKSDPSFLHSLHSD